MLHTYEVELWQTPEKRVIVEVEASSEMLAKVAAENIHGGEAGQARRK